MKYNDLIGPIPNEHGFKRRMRIHQGWWRAFVLNQEPGPHPNDSSKSVCNTINDGETTQNNFLSRNIVKVVKASLKDHPEQKSGIIEEDRLFNNLLSSQPLCFNFFGELEFDKELALNTMRNMFPQVTRVNKVLFEYAPEENYTNDNSAFDVAIEVESKNQRGLIGLECKYTDTFSAKEYDKTAYQSIYRNSSAFTCDYKEYVKSDYNQLFRNQLIAEALLQNDEYDFAITGLFCHQDDKAMEIGKQFQAMLKGGKETFQIITYQSFIESIQKLDLSWEQRELSMMLWARYCGVKLSENVCKKL